MHGVEYSPHGVQSLPSLYTTSKDLLLVGYNVYQGLFRWDVGHDPEATSAQDVSDRLERQTTEEAQDLALRGRLYEYIHWGVTDTSGRRTRYARENIRLSSSRLLP